MEMNRVFLLKFCKVSLERTLLLETTEYVLESSSHIEINLL